MPIVEAGVVHAGSDIDNFYVGIPLPGTGNVVGFINTITDKGRARIGLTFWSEEGTIIGQTRESVGSAYYKNTNRGPDVAHWPSIDVPDRVAKVILDRY